MDTISDQIKKRKDQPSVKDHCLAIYEICKDPFMALSPYGLMFASIFTFVAMIASTATAPVPTFILCVIAGGFMIGIPTISRVIGHAALAVQRKAQEIYERRMK